MGIVLVAQCWIASQVEYHIPLANSTANYCHNVSKNIWHSLEDHVGTKFWLEFSLELIDYWHESIYETVLKAQLICARMQIDFVFNEIHWRLFSTAGDEQWQWHWNLFINFSTPWSLILTMASPYIRLIPCEPHQFIDTSNEIYDKFNVENLWRKTRLPQLLSLCWWFESWTIYMWN